MHSTSISNTRVLIVDDDRGITMMAKRFLEQVGRCQVREENFSERAFATAAEYRPDIILLDWNMPILNGGEIAALLQADPSLRHIPVVIITGYGDRARKLGFPILEKPFSWPALMKLIETSVAESTSRAAA